jgi:hypothetical protein
VKDGKNERIAFLDGKGFEWTLFFEEFAKDHYFWGPEYKAEDSIKGKELKGERLVGGDYLIRVFNPLNEGKYVLVVGFLEKFPFKEILKALFIIPKLKVKFFEYPLAKVFTSPFIWAYLFFIYLFAFIIGFVYRFIVKKLAESSSRKANKNIGRGDRLIRLLLGIGLFLWAIITSWIPVLLFFSGFAIFEALFSWCGFYAIMGKNSCPS